MAVLSVLLANINRDEIPKIEVSKKTILSNQGDLLSQVYIVEKGCLKSFVTDGAGKEHILHLAPEKWIVSDMGAFIHGKPSVMTIQAIEDSVLLVVDKSLFNKMGLLSASTEELLKEIRQLQNHIIALNNRLIHLLSSNAEQRYRYFVETYPSLVQRLPQKLIASYLGMTPEFLSRIRKRLTNK